LKHIQFIAFIKWSAENYLSTMMLKRNICSEFEHLYWEDGTEASQLCTHSRDSVSSDAQKLS
jgi:hypothetical protein